MPCCCKPFLIAVALSCGAVVIAEAAPKVYSLDAVPASWTPAIEHAQAGMAALQQRLVVRLTEVLGGDGPAAAMKVCHTEAPIISDDVAAKEKIALGRTSFRVRNGRNAPRAWARTRVMAAQGKRADEVGPVVVDLGDRIGVLRPIPTGGVCLTCHGAKATLADDVRAALDKHYPGDRATGFAEGDLRGFFWAEVRKPAAKK
jgi:hypothetical protein